ncbi:MAG: GH25 family lysozyme [Bacillota bacterium]|nr:GH25 family lysozyme [Bacillota bacterium]
MQSRSGSNLEGIDVSHYDGTIDYSRVKGSGIQVVYIKATEGTGFSDPYLSQNYENAKANGLKVGFYHYFRPNNDANARQQAQFFVNNIKGMEYDCRLALDLENAQSLDKDTLSNLAKVFLDEVKSLTGSDVVVYTYTYFAKTNITPVLREYPLWIAHYGVSTPGSNPIWDNWIGFQYSDTGSVDGVSGKVDMDEFTGDILLGGYVPVDNGPGQTSAITTVKDVQTELNNRYRFNIAVDGIAGSQTFMALYKAVQIELNNLGRNLAVDGIPGPLTLGAAVTLREGDMGGLVWALQAILICKSYSVGSSGADGIFGSRTLAGVERFQFAEGLIADGIVGPLTWRKLLT